MQSTEKVCEHQNTNYLAMMRERDDARAALAAERDRVDQARYAVSCMTDPNWAEAMWKARLTRLLTREATA